MAGMLRRPRRSAERGLASSPSSRWTCSFPLYDGEGGGDFAGCSREAPVATVSVFARKPVPGT
jgi:hypothetical protein